MQIKNNNKHELTEPIIRPALSQNTLEYGRYDQGSFPGAADWFILDWILLWNDNDTEEGLLFIN